MPRQMTSGSGKKPWTHRGRPTAADRAHEARKQQEREMYARQRAMDEKRKEERR